MARAPLTEEEILQFRKRAVEVATALFAKRGFESVTMRGLASELGCSPMTPYRYFTNHEELIIAVKTRAFSRFADKMEESYQPGQSGLRNLRALKEAYIAFAVAHPDAYRIMFELRATVISAPLLEKASYRGFSVLHSAMKQAVEEGDKQGNALSLAHLAWASTHGLVSLHLAGKLRMNRSIEELAAIEGEY